MAGAFCSQTSGSMGAIMCLDALTLSTLTAFLPSGYDIPAEMRSCLDELANNGRCSDRSLITQAQCDADAGESWTPTDTPTSQLSVKDICATSATPCPSSDDADDADDADDENPAPKDTSGARLANGWRAALVAVTSYVVWMSC